MSREAIEDRRQRAREAAQDAMAPDLFRYEQQQIITAAEIAIETATRVKITREAIEAFGEAWAARAMSGVPRTPGDRRSAGLAAALAALGFEVEE